MVKDRLAELQKNASQANGSSELRNRGKPAANSKEVAEKKKLLPIERDNTVESHLNISTQLSAEMGRLEEQINEIHALHVGILSQHSATGLTAELSSKTEAVQSNLGLLRTAVRALNEEVANSKTDSASSSDRIIFEQVKRLTRNLTQLAERFHREEMEYKEKSRKKYTDYMHVYGINLSEDDVEDAIKEGTLTNKIKEMTLQLNQKKLLVDDLKQRTEEILKIESSIRELKEMYEDLLMLVNSQDEMLDNIQRNVEQSEEYATQAKQNLKDALKKKRQAKKLKILAAVGATGVLAAILTASGIPAIIAAIAA